MHLFCANTMGESRGVVHARSRSKLSPRPSLSSLTRTMCTPESKNLNVYTWRSAISSITSTQCVYDGVVPTSTCAASQQIPWWRESRDNWTKAMSNIYDCVESFCINFSGIFHVALLCRQTLYVVVVVYDFRFVAHYFSFVCLLAITIVCVCNVEYQCHTHAHTHTVCVCVRACGTDIQRCRRQRFCQ